MVIGSSQHLQVPPRPMRVMNVVQSGQYWVPRSRVSQFGHSYTVWGRRGVLAGSVGLVTGGW